MSANLPELGPPAQPPRGGPRRLPGVGLSASPGRAVLEGATIGLLAAGPLILRLPLALGTEVGAMLFPAILPPWTGLRGSLDGALGGTSYLGLLALVFVFVIPLWLAVRLAVPAPGWRPWLVEHARAAGGLLLLLLLGPTLARLLRWLLPPSDASEAPLVTRLGTESPLEAAAFFMGWGLATFLFVRATILVAAHARRYARSALASLPAPGAPTALGGEVGSDTTSFYRITAAIGLGALVLWVIRLALLFFAPEQVYVPPLYGTAIPVEVGPSGRAEWQSLGLALPGIVVLLEGLWLALFVRPAEPAARLFTLLCVLMGVPVVVPNLDGAGVVLYVVVLFIGTLASPVLLHFGLIFPRLAYTLGAATPAWSRRTLRALYVGFGLVALVRVVTDLQAGYLMNELPPRLFGAAPQGSSTQLVVGLLVILAYLLLALIIASPLLAWPVAGALLVRTWRGLERARRAMEPTGDEPVPAAAFDGTIEDARQQLKWVGLGGVIAAVSMTLSFPLAGGWLLTPGARVFGIFAPVTVGIVLAWLVLSLPLATLVALLQHRLWNVDLLINRATVYGAVTTAAAVTYVVVGWLLEQAAGWLLPRVLSEQVLARVIDRAAWAPDLLAALIVAFLLRPIERWVRSRVRRPVELSAR